jgi:hypothetical protein
MSLTDRGGVFRCIYDRSEQQEIIDYSLTHLLKRVSDAKQALPHSMHDIVYNFGRHFLGQLLITAAIFKDPSFVEESEWRLVLRSMRPDWPESPLRFRSAGNRIIPYLELSFPSTGLEGLVKEVVVGPNPNAMIARKLASEVFEYSGFGKVATRPSIIPFRDW